jgi:hypothetical protein
MVDLSTRQICRLILMVITIFLISSLTACDLAYFPVGDVQPSPTGILSTPSPTSMIPSPINTIATVQTPTETPTLESTNTPTITPTPPPDFILQLGSPQAIPNVFRPELGCNWMGIAGQVFGPDESPLLNIVVEVGGSLAGEPYMGLGMTGSTPYYGLGGFEVTLSDRPIASHGTLWVVLSGLDGAMLTERIFFDTYGNCEQNLLILNFSPFGSIPGQIFLPLINQ